MNDTLGRPGAIDEADRTRANETPRIIGASIVLGSAALMVLGVQPILLGGLIAAGRISEAGLGQVALAEVAALALGSCLGPILMNNGAMRASAALASLVLALANLGTCWASDVVMLLGIRALAGFAEGLMLGAAVVVMTYTRHPDRIAGLFLGLQTAPQMVAALVFPAMLLPRFGVNSGYVALAVLALIGSAAAFMITDRVVTRPNASKARLKWSPALVLTLAALICQNAGIGAAWNYSERLATQHGLSPTLAGLSLSASLLCQIIGSLTVAWIGWRLPFRVMLIMGAAAQSGIILMMTIGGAPMLYVIAVCLFGLFWLALQPYQVNQAIAVDGTRFLAVMLTPIALIGFSLGAFLVSFVMPNGDVLPGFWAAAVLLISAAACYAAARPQARASKLPS